MVVFMPPVSEHEIQRFCDARPDVEIRWPYNGQWLWVENLTGLPIGRAIADELLTASGAGTP